MTPASVRLHSDSHIDADVSFRHSECSDLGPVRGLVSAFAKAAPRRRRSDAPCGWNLTGGRPKSDKQLFALIYADNLQCITILFRHVLLGVVEILNNAQFLDCVLAQRIAPL
jgi:hypothetical protein